MSELKFSAADWCFLKSGIDPAAYYPALRALGYEAVEFCSKERWDAARAAGLAILNLGTPGMQDGLNQRQNHERLLPEIRATIATAQENDIHQVVVFSGNRTEGVSDDIGWENCHIALTELAKDAEAAGILLVLEMLNSFDHQHYQADSSQYGLSLVKAVDSPALRILYDVYHIDRMGEDAVTIALENLPWIGHFHIAGSQTRGYPAQDGAIDYRALIREAHRAGYRGYWGVEFLTRDEDPQQLLARFTAQYGDQDGAPPIPDEVG